MLISHMILSRKTKAASVLALIVQMCNFNYFVARASLWDRGTVLLFAISCKIAIFLYSCFFFFFGFVLCVSKMNFRIYNFILCFCDIALLLNKNTNIGFDNIENCLKKKKNEYIFEIF